MNITVLAKRTCSISQFACDEKRCISKRWRCDGEPDCPKGTDEMGCAERRCSEIGKFKCKSGMCVDLKYRCNGDDDCGDGSDERDCGKFLNYPTDLWRDNLVDKNCLFCTKCQC